MGRRKSHIACPLCTSSDAYTVYPDGHGHCFSCNKSTYPDSGDRGSIIEIPEGEKEYKFVSQRGISTGTFEYYGVYTEVIDSEPFKVGFVYPNNAIKFRLCSKKEFFSEGPMSDAGLFGKDKFDPGSKDSITITEGEFDALSVFEITRGNTAAVSVRSSSSAKVDCTRDYEYINSFRRIVLAFDSDDAGQGAAKSVSGLFDYSKVYHVKLNRHKDANDYLKANEAEEFLKAWQNAKRYAPDNIISTMPEFARSLKEAKEDVLATYPHEGLQNALYGLLNGSVTVFKGDEGIGKTEIFRWIESHVLKTTDLKIGILHLEEDNGTTVRALAGYQLGINTSIPDSGVTEIDILKAINRLGGDSGRINIHSSFDIEDETGIVDNIRFLVSGAGCKVVFLDHISWLATGQDDEDERKKLDRISQKLKLLAKELRFALLEIAHVNDQGKTRGSRNITKVADTVIHLTRDLTSPDDNTRRTTYFTIEKARLGGNTGPAGSAIFDRASGQLREVDLVDTIKMPNLESIEVKPTRIMDKIPF